jgi:hypothetical protein
VENVMSEKADKNNQDELILGLVTPQRFLQAAAMLPALTIGTSLVMPFLGVSFGAGGVTLFFFIILRSLLDRRKLPTQIWMMAAAQALATAYVIYQHGFDLAGEMLGA